MRELENVVERAVVLARGSVVEVTDLPENVAERAVMLERQEAGEGSGSAEGAGAGAAAEGFFKIKVGTPLAEVEQRILEETLRLTKGNKTLTAKILGIDPKMVFRKLKAGEAEDPAAADERAGG